MEDPKILNVVKNTVFIYGINESDLDGLPITEVPQIQFYLRRLTKSNFNVKSFERLSDCEAFGCFPLRVTLGHSDEAEEILNHQDFFRVGQHCYHRSSN